MSGIMLNLLGNTFGGAPVPIVGSAFGGGFFAGQISTTANGIATHNLVIGPISTAQTTNRWRNVSGATPGADSFIDGPQNTADMVAHGNATAYPCAHFCNDLVIGGFSDWYMPARNELEVCYYNLKPTTATNQPSSGINANAVPARASNYSSGTPAQTSASDFKDTGAEDFDQNDYWTSTEAGSSFAYTQYFDNGFQSDNGKTSIDRVRAVRRVAV